MQQKRHNAATSWHATWSRWARIRNNRSGERVNCKWNCVTSFRIYDDIMQCTQHLNGKQQRKKNEKKLKNGFALVESSIVYATEPASYASFVTRGECTYCSVCADNLDSALSYSHYGSSIRPFFFFIFSQRAGVNYLFSSFGLRRLTHSTRTTTTSAVFFFS